MFSEHHQLDLTGLGCPLNIECCGKQLLYADTGEWMSGWDIIYTLKTEILRVRGNLLLNPTDIVPIKEKIPPEPNILPFLIGNSSPLKSYGTPIICI